MKIPEKGELERLYSDSPRGFIHRVKGRWPHFYSKMCNEFEETNTFSESIYLFFHETDERKCNLSECQKKCGFLNFGEGYRKFCSNDCKGKYESMKATEARTCQVCGEDFETKKRTDKFLCSNECKYEYQRKEDVKSDMVEKAVETQKKKYGGVGFASDELNEKARKTNLQQNGGRKYTNRKKFKETMDKRYSGIGVESSEIRQKVRETRKKNFYNRILNGERLREYIEPLFSEKEYLRGEYSDYYKFKCKKCGNKFEDRLKDGNVPRCYNCNPIYCGDSSLENELFEFVKSILDSNVTINQNDRNVVDKNMEFDIFVPEFNVGIEFNGLYWHSDLVKSSRNYHLNKTKECENKGIQLIHVFENEWKHKKNIVKKKIKQTFGKIERSVDQKNMNVKKLSEKKKDGFLEINHLHGSDKSDYGFGLYESGKLVGIITFIENENVLEISRFCFSRPIKKGFKKLFWETVEKINQMSKGVVSYVDRRYPSKGKMYEDVGFNFVGKTDPKDWYFKNGSDRLKRKAQVKKKNLEKFDSNLSDWKNMKLNDYNRIWDCGKYKYEIFLN